MTRIPIIVLSPFMNWYVSGRLVVKNLVIGMDQIQWHTQSGNICLLL